MNISEMEMSIAATPYKTPLFGLKTGKAIVKTEPECGKYIGCSMVMIEKIGIEG